MQDAVSRSGRRKEKSCMIVRLGSCNKRVKVMIRWKISEMESQTPLAYFIRDHGLRSDPIQAIVQRAHCLRVAGEWVLGSFMEEVGVGARRRVPHCPFLD